MDLGVHTSTHKESEVTGQADGTTPYTSLRKHWVREGSQSLLVHTYASEDSVLQPCAAASQNPITSSANTHVAAGLS